MKDDRKFEALLHDALRRRGAPAPFAVDVRNRVMARVAAIGPPPRREMGLRQFGRWTAAASVVGATLLAAAFRQGPSIAAVVSDLGNTIVGTAGAALKLTSPAGALAATLSRLALAFVASAQAIMQPLEPFQPLARALLALTTVAMMIIATFVVGRDFGGRVAEKE